MPARALARRLQARLRDLWTRARQERSSPREVGWSVALGVFCGCTPFVGFHGWLALGLATLLRLNRLWAFLGSRVSTTLVLAWLTFLEIECGHWLRTGAFAPLEPHDVLAHGRERLGDWMLGAGVVGVVLAAAFGLGIYVLALRWEARRPVYLSRSTPDGSPRPSSECPPSAPPAPSP